MKVFCYDKTDLIAAETIEAAAEFYTVNFGEIQESDLEEWDVDLYMWYGFNWDNPDISSLISNGNRTFKIKKNPRGDFKFAIDLTFEEVILIDEITEPRLISST